MKTDDSNEKTRTATFAFQGYSDDTFGEYGVTGDEYDNCASGEPIEFTLEHGEKALVIVGQYGPGSSGGWLIGVAPFDEDSVPDWPIRLKAAAIDCPYSPLLLIDAPADATLTCVTREEGTDE